MATKTAEWNALAESKVPANLPRVLGATRRRERAEARGAIPPADDLAEAARDCRDRGVVLPAVPHSGPTLGTGCAALGVLVLHGAPASFADSLKKVNAPNDLVPRWRDLVATGAARLLGARKVFAKGSKLERRCRGWPRAAVQTAWLVRAEAGHEGDLSELLTRLGDGPATDIAERLVLLISFPERRRSPMQPRR